MGLPVCSFSCICLLFSSPEASVHTNDLYSDYFGAGRGSRQGCPVSPLLFAVDIKPLSMILRSSPLFKGIVRNGTEYKLSVYADDLLLYITDPGISCPCCFEYSGKLQLLFRVQIKSREK